MTNTTQSAQHTSIQSYLLHAWYQNAWWLWLLWPVAFIFQMLTLLRRKIYLLFAFNTDLSTPIIVVGNISIGGTGKTPLVIRLARELCMKGYKPGIISRGYKSQAPQYPYCVTPQSTVLQVGDEPLLMVQETGCPVVIDANRRKAAQYMEQHFDCDVIISDDGLQHYALPRDIEIIVVDGNRKLGNGLCFPAGPLREPPSRLLDADIIVINGHEQSDSSLKYYGMQLQTVSICHMKSAQQMTVEQFVEQNFNSEQSSPAVNVQQQKQLHGLAAIGHPRRFFETLSELGFTVIEHEFPDHYQFAPADLYFDDLLPVLMTAKDAVKCVEFAEDHWWYLKVEAKLDEQIMAIILNKLNANKMS